MSRPPHVDTPRRGNSSQNADRYASLLWDAAEGHALFHPRIEGCVGDCGYIENGTFTKLFHVHDPPDGLEAFRIETGDILVEKRLNAWRPLFISTTNPAPTYSRSGVRPGLDPNDMQISVDVPPDLSRDFAFLAFAGPAREVETLKSTARQRLRQWVSRNGMRILERYSLPGLLVLYQAVKAPGWVGALAYRETPPIKRILTLVIGRGSESIAAPLLIETCGPPKVGDGVWSAVGAPGYTIVVQYMLFRRPRWVRVLQYIIGTAEAPVDLGKTRQPPGGTVTTPLRPATPPPDAGPSVPSGQSTSNPGTEH
ncbi:hypothetical protein AURDEDRAFT_187993, partial [Auricularia subglabra TFB-10046 SS5]